MRILPGNPALAESFQRVMAHVPDGNPLPGTDPGPDLPPSTGDPVPSGPGEPDGPAEGIPF